MKTPITSPLTKFAALAATLALSATPAFAADATWTNLTSGAWTNPAMWNPNAAPGITNGTTSADTASFDGTSLTANTTVTVDANRNIKNIIITNTNAAFNFTLTGGSLKLTDGGGIYATGTRNGSIGSSIEIQGNGGSATISNSGGNYTFSGAISGVSTAGNTTTLFLTGTNSGSTIQSAITDGTNGGKLAVVVSNSASTGGWQFNTGANVNTFSGGFTLVAGIANAAKASAFGTGVLTINGGSISAALAGATLSNSSTVINGDFAINTGASFSLGTMGVSLGTAAGTTRTITNAGTLRIDGVISDGTTANKIALVDTSNGTLILNGTNTFTGGLTMGRGSLTLGNSSALGTGALTTASGGTLNLNAATSGLVFSNDLILGGASANGIGGGTNDIIWAGTVLQSGANRPINRVGRMDITGNVYLSEASGTGRILTVGGANNGSGSISGVIANFNGGAGTAGGITKAGTGTWTLSGTNTYTGTTTVSAGALIINGDNSAATGAVIVATNATLGGSGTIGGNTGIANGGTLSPGNSPGTITFANNLSMSNGSTLIFEAGDLVNVGGVLDLDNAWKLTLSSNANWQLGGTTVLFDYGTLAASPYLTPVITDNTGLGGSLSLSSDGSTILLNGYSVVPEPSTLALLGLTGIALIGYRIRRRNR